MLSSHFYFILSYTKKININRSFVSSMGLEKSWTRVFNRSVKNQGKSFYSEFDSFSFFDFFSFLGLDCLLTELLLDDGAGDCPISSSQITLFLLKIGQSGIHIYIRRKIFVNIKCLAKNSLDEGYFIKIIYWQHLE